MIEDDFQILQLCPAPFSDCWIKSFDDTGKAYFQRVSCFALVIDGYSNRRVISLCMDNDGLLCIPEGFEVIYSTTRPDEGNDDSNS